MAEGPIWKGKHGETKLETLQREYEEQGHPLLLSYALTECHESNTPPPQWLVDALREKMEGDATKRPGRGVRSPSEAAAQAKIDYARCMTIHLLRVNGVAPDEVFEAASQWLEDSQAFAGSEWAMRASWRREKKHFKRWLGAG